MKTPIISTLVLVTLICGITAQAGDRKTYPGSACKSWDNNTQVKSDLNRGRIKNYTTLTEKVICPIVRDVNSTTGSINSTVYVYNYNPDQSGYCRLRTRDSWGRGGDYALTQFTGVGEKILTVGPVYPEYKGSVFLECKLPGRVVGSDESYIASYEVVEY